MKLSTFALSAAFGLILTSVAVAQFGIAAGPPRGTTPPCVNCEPTEPGEPFDPDFPGGSSSSGSTSSSSSSGGSSSSSSSSSSSGGSSSSSGGSSSSSSGSSSGSSISSSGGSSSGGMAHVTGDGDCGDKLGYLRRVTPNQVESVGTDDLVDIVPICRERGLTSEQEDVAQLRPVIGQNPVLDTELDQEGYNPEDVVGVIVEGTLVTLYVHRL